ncbi:MAG: ABC transporter permease [Bacteroidota bacterium]
MRALIQTEFFKLFSSLRTHLTFGIAIILMVIIDFGIYVEGETILSYLLQPLKDYFLVQGNILNGYLIAYLSLNTLWVHLPVLVVIVSAYIFSSEFEFGTIKVLMSQPISRRGVMISKILVMLIYNIIFMFIVATFAMLPAILIFGTGDVMVINNGVQFLLESSFLWRFALAIIFATISMIAFSSLSMFCAVYFRDSLTAILVSFGILILHTLFQSFSIDISSAWQNILFTYHMSNWQLLFVTEVPWNQMLISVLFLLSMSLIFAFMSIFRFKRLNITE